MTYIRNQTGATASDTIRDLWVVYDGECPFCSRFVTLYRLRQRGHAIHLIDARSDHPLVAAVRAHRFDLNAGMVVRWRERFYHGADAMHLLGVLGSDQSAFNRLNQAIFSRPTLARILYPWLVRGRRLTLALLGRKLIDDGFDERESSR